MTAPREAGDEFAGLADEAAELGLALGTPPTRAAVPTGDGSVSALAWGPGPPELLALHGVGLNAHSFDATAMALGRPLVALDLPGHGRSDWRPDGRYDPELLAPAVTAAWSALAPTASVVVGQSLGGLTGIVLAARQPERVGHLVLVDALPWGGVGQLPVGAFLAGPESFGSRDEIVVRARSFGLGRSDASVARAVELNTVVRPDGRVVWRHHLGQHPEQVRLGPDWSALWEPLAAYRGPLTLVRASRGYLSDELVAELTRRRPASTVVSLDSGHNVQEDDPVALAAVLAEVLAST